MKITKELIKDIREDLKEAISEVEAKYNIDCKFGNVSFSELDFKMTLNAALLSEHYDSIEQYNFNKYAHLYDLKPTDFMRNVIVDGDTMKLAGLNNRAPKYPYVVIDESGKEYRAKNISLI